jgi:hypothetical protein
MCTGKIKCCMLNVNVLQKPCNDNIIKESFLEMLNECRDNIWSYLYKEALRGVMFVWRTS